MNNVFNFQVLKLPLRTTLVIDSSSLTNFVASLLVQTYKIKSVIGLFIYGPYSSSELLSMRVLAKNFLSKEQWSDSCFFDVTHNLYIIYNLGSFVGVEQSSPPKASRGKLSSQPLGPISHSTTDS